MNKHERIFLKRLKIFMDRGLINKQQYRTFKGQILSGDREGAIKGIRKIFKRNRVKATI